MRFITIPLSHYCERARWALDHAGVDYREEHHLQLLSRRHTRKAGGGTTVPVLVTDDGTLADSGDIVALADARAAADRKLYPADPSARAEVEALERELAGDFGVETRRWAYVAFFPLKKLLLRYNGGHAPSFERFILRATFPLARRMATKEFELTAEAVERGRPVIDRTLDDIAARIADGRPYLFGDRFTAADLTFASMAAPVLLPEHYGVPMPRVDELPQPTRGQVEAFRAHPAGAFALRVYADQRRPRAAA